MNLAALLDLLRDAPLVASVQASEGSPTDSSETLLQLARASLQQGSKLLRLQGVDNIRRIKSATGAPVIGLIKRDYAASEIYITPTTTEVSELLDVDCEVIAFDGTMRLRPNGEALHALIAQVHRAGRLAVADCDNLASAEYSLEAGADLVGTTLSGYTPDSPHQTAPDLNLVRKLVHFGAPVLAEGRYADPWQARMAVRAGAAGVVIGGALNDPVKQTRRFADAITPLCREAGAIDIGGTWLRAGIVTLDGIAREIERIPLPPTRRERIRWINDWIRDKGIEAVGIGAGGTIDPASGEVVFSKPIIPDHVGTFFSREIHAERVVALNDGHATAWAHGLHPRYAGLRVATLALGTGVGFGLVDLGRIFMGPKGQHPRINDTPTRQGKIYDDLLGGAAVTAKPTELQKLLAIEAAREAVRLIYTLYYPDAIVLAGGIGLQPWLPLDRLSDCAGCPVELTPYGADAGLIGAGFLAIYPPS